MAPPPFPRLSQEDQVENNTGNKGGHQQGGSGKGEGLCLMPLGRQEGFLEERAFSLYLFL